MPVCTIHLLSLAVPISQFLKSLQESDAKPLTTARVVRWIVKPTRFSKDALLNTPQQWEILLILPEATASLPPALNKLVKHSWSIQAGIPSKLVSSLEATNRNLLYPKPEDVLPLTGALSRPRIADSSQGLELSNELRRWIEDGQRPKGPVSMLNLLAFQPGKKEEYLKYGKAFAESIGSSRGGVAKIVGKIVPQSCSDGSDEWEEMALAHYPSLEHFADMIASEDYQAVNKQHRMGSLKDTCILCTTEVELLWDRRIARL